MPDFPSSVAYPAATVVLLRDGDGGCEVLLVHRNARLSFHGGAWVFPGGRIDPQDYVASGEQDVIAAARRAAVREAREETGLAIAADGLVLISRWITPDLLPKRFDTWFFAAAAGGDPVRVDGGEIHAHRWLRPELALAAHEGGEIELPPPTFVTLRRLAGHGRVGEVLAMLARDPVETFVPRLHVAASGACSLYPGDVAYEDGELDRPGPRHRLWMGESGWRYERDR